MNRVLGHQIVTFQALWNWYTQTKTKRGHLQTSDRTTMKTKKNNNKPQVEVNPQYQIKKAANNLQPAK